MSAPDFIQPVGDGTYRYKSRPNSRSVTYTCPSCGHTTSLPDYVANKIDTPGTTFFISCSHKGRSTIAKPARMRRKEQRDPRTSSEKEATTL